MPLVFSQAIPTPFCSYRVVEKLYGVPEGWTEDGAPPPSTAMKFRMAIRHDRMAGVEQKTVDIATPGNRPYGQFMTREETDGLLHPSDNAVNAILS